MNQSNIGDIYAANDRIREQLIATVGNLSEAAAAAGDDWSIAKIVEHLAMVEDGMTRICAKLLSAGAERSDGEPGQVKISREFLAKAAAARDMKLEAPERVQPSGEKTIAESLATMSENRARLNELKSQFESIDCSGLTFPHPAFGELTAHEWLALLGGHESRHIAQIEKILAA